MVDFRPRLILGAFQRVSFVGHRCRFTSGARFRRCAAFPRRGCRKTSMLWDGFLRSCRVRHEYAGSDRRDALRNLSRDGRAGAARVVVRRPLQARHRRPEGRWAAPRSCQDDSPFAMANLSSGSTLEKYARPILSRLLMRHSTSQSSAFLSESWPIETMARISSSVKAVTSFAPQNSSSGRRFRKAGLGYSGTQRSGSKTFHSNLADGGKVGIAGEHPVGRRQTQTEELARGTMPAEVIGARTRAVGALRAAAQRGAEIELEVADDKNGRPR